MDSHNSSLLEQELVVRNGKRKSGCSSGNNNSRHKHNNKGVSLFVCIVNVTSIVMINLSRQLSVAASSLENRSHHQNQHNNSHLQLALPHSHNKNELEQQTKGDNSNSNSNINFKDNQQSSLDSSSDNNNSLGQTSALMYLQRYGYISSPSPSYSSSASFSRISSSEAILNNNLISDESFTDAIKSFQKFAGIAQTGLVDEETQKFMQMPRCGNTDRPEEPLEQPPDRLNIPLNYNHQQNHGRQVTKSGGSILNSVKRRRRRRKRYALQGSKWRRQELTYRISQYPTRFNGKRHEVDAQIEKAFGIWSHVAPINFVVKRHGRVHIDIRFASGDHGDGDAFDGPGNTLAHAYFPQYGGDAHFDDQEYWTIDSYTGTNIFQVAAHELGHSLGLGHSNVREALMAPFYQKYKPNFKLHIDDVLAIQALYGEKPLFLQPDVPQITTTTTTTTTTEKPTTTTTSTTPQPVVIPSSSTYKPTFSLFPGGINIPYQPTLRSKPGLSGGENNPAGSDSMIPGPLPNDIFTNNGIDTTNNNSFGSTTGATNKPTNVPSESEDREDRRDTSITTTSTTSNIDLCSDPMIDAITRTEDGSSYVFKGDSYWLLTSDGLGKGYPRKIYQDWDGLPSNLDAALTWADGKTFFFKGNKYWRFRNKHRDIGYPKLISAGFAGIPNDIDAAFVWSGNGRTYIFKGTEYWRFDSKADPPVSSEYPKSIKVWNGVPSHINAAFKWENNVTYFFKGSQYYRFNDKEFKIESRGRPPFPRNSAEWWFGCVGSNTLAAQRAAAATSPTSSSLDHFSTMETNNNNNLLQGNYNNNYNNKEQMKPASESNANDWSYFTGLDGSAPPNFAKIPGTHISDHESKPPVQVNNNNNNNEDDTEGGQINFYHRIGGINNFFIKQARSASSSSSPLSAINNNPIVFLITLMTTLIVVFHGHHHNTKSHPIQR